MQRGVQISEARSDAQLRPTFPKRLAGKLWQLKLMHCDGLPGFVRWAHDGPTARPGTASGQALFCPVLSMTGRPING
jgi:hypothetical protein